MPQENKYNKFINLIDDIKLNESRLRIYAETHPETYYNSRKAKFKKEYQLDSRAEVNFETNFTYDDGSKVCLGDRVTYQNNSFFQGIDKTYIAEFIEKTYMVKFDEKREMISQDTYDKIVKQNEKDLYELDLYMKRTSGRTFLWNKEKEHSHNFFFLGSQGLENHGNAFKELLLLQEQNLQFEKTTGDLVFRNKNLEIRGFDYHDKIHIYHDELQEFIDLCKSNPIIQKFKDDPVSKDIEIRHESKLSDFPSFSVNLNAFIELSMCNDIYNKEKLYKMIGYINGTAKGIGETFLSIEKNIKDFEKKKGVLLPDAKERIAKSILVDINKIKKQNAHYSTLNGAEQYKAKINEFMHENQKIIDNIDNFANKYQAKGKANTR